MKGSAALAVASAAVAQASNINPLILGGTIVPPGTKTYTVGLRQSATGQTICGGSLITPTHVLTAAHCAGYGKFVSIGSHFLTGASDGERISIKKETPHPRYNEGTTTPGEDDTASFDYNVIELASPSKFAPVKLYSADSEIFAGAQATVMGWGYTAEGGVQSNELLRVNVPVLTDADCKTRGLQSYPLSESMLCAGGARNRDGCQGDSGGPLILEQTTGDVLVGIVSWGDGCGRADLPGVYSKVSLEKEWIQSLAPNATWV